MQEPAASPFRYRLLRKLGEGGMGEVYLALQETAAGVPRRVALKRVVSDGKRQAHLVQMFREEMRLAARLSHPAIAHTYDFGCESGVYFIAMEFVDGISVGRLLRNGPGRAALPLGSALRIAVDVCAALHHAHELRDEGGQWLGVVHRDVSPQNILVSCEGAVKLVDFGIARVMTAPSFTGQGELKGKLSYMSPEQTEPNASIDRRSDVFALGSVLYEMLTGTPAFGRKNAFEVVDAVRRAEPASLRLVRPDLTEDVELIVTRAMARRPEDRFSNAAEMQLEIEQVAARLGVVTSSVLLSTLVRSIHPPEEPAPIVGTEAGPTVAEEAPRRARRKGDTVRLAGDSLEYGPTEPAEPPPGLEPSAQEEPGQSVEDEAGLIDPPLPRSRRWFVLASLGTIAVALCTALLVAAPWRSQSSPRTERPASGQRDVEPSPPTRSSAVAAAPAVLPVATTSAPTIATRSRSDLAAAPLAARRRVTGTAPETRSRSATGRLLLVSEPEAIVLLQGRQVCQTPCTTPPLPAGRHLFVFVPADGRRVARRLEVPRRKTSRVRLQLR